MTIALRINKLRRVKINQQEKHLQNPCICNNITSMMSTPTANAKRKIPSNKNSMSRVKSSNNTIASLIPTIRNNEMESSDTLAETTNLQHHINATSMPSKSLQERHFSIFGHSKLLIVGLLLMVITACSDLVEGALHNVSLIIEPPAVRRGQHAILRCQYDLEGAPLYSAKFYRGQLEFYRYTPGEFPNTKVFPFPGIHVDVTSSNASQVLIRNVGFGLSGNFSCEVTADAPLFSTATAMGTMQVVELPDKRPQLFTEHTRYEPGDILRANCSTPASRPKAELKLSLNNFVISSGSETQYIRTVDNLIASRISLKLQLQASHFSIVNPSVYGHSVYGMNSVHGGGLVLRCTATIGDLYQEYKEIELGTPQKDPVPARVTLSSGSTVRNFLSFLSSGGNARAATSIMSLPQLLLLSSFWYYSLLASLLGRLVASGQALLRYKSTQQQRRQQHVGAGASFTTSAHLELLSQR